MTGIAILALILFFPAVARVTRLVNMDEITDPLRIWIMRRTGTESTLSYFISCPWCVSIWVAAVAAFPVLWAIGLPLWLAALLIPAASWFTGLAARLDDEELEVEVSD